MARYHANALSTVEVLQELINLARDIRSASRRSEELNLSREEIPFYDARRFERIDEKVKRLRPTPVQSRIPSTSAITESGLRNQPSTPKRELRLRTATPRPRPPESLGRQTPRPNRDWAGRLSRPGGGAGARRPLAGVLDCRERRAAHRCLQIIDPAMEETHYWGDVAPNLRALDIWIGEEADLGQGYGTAIMLQVIAHYFTNPRWSPCCSTPW